MKNQKYMIKLENGKELESTFGTRLRNQKLIQLLRQLRQELKWKVEDINQQGENIRMTEAGFNTREEDRAKGFSLNIPIPEDKRSSQGS